MAIATHGDGPAGNDDLLRLADRVVSLYEDRSGLEMALVVGSVARGLVDEASDLDVVLFWDGVSGGRDDPPPLEALGAQRVASVPTPSGHFDKYRLAGRFVDVESMDRQVLQQLATNLADGHAKPGAMKIAAGLRDAIPVVGPDALAAWQSQIVYSESLAVSQVTEHGRRLLPVRSLYAMTWARGDALGYASRVSEVLLSAVALVGAANRAFIPVEDPKWLPWHLDRLDRVPRRLAVRIDDAMRSPSPAASEDADALLHEVLDLVDGLVPGANTAAPRYVLSLRRYS
jgi:hypothetical protein